MEAENIIGLIKKFGLIIGGSVLAIILGFNCFEDVAAGEIAVIQSPMTGEMSVVTTPGWAWQGGGTVTKYQRSNQLWFSNKEDEGGKGAIKIGFNDFGEGTVSGSVRWYMPTNKEQILKLHSDYGTQESIEFKLIKQAVTKAIYMSGPLMSSKEAVSEKKTALLTYTEDQANNGIYRTRPVKTKDTLADTNSKPLEIVYKDGKPQIIKASDVATYGVVLSNFTINEILFSPAVTKQIADQQKLVMAVQTSRANAQKATQDAITTMKQGEADAAKAKWEQEVIKAKLVTEAESRNRVAELDVKTADLKKQKDILEGQGIATKKRLIMEADGALDQKLQAYKEVQKYWADAFGNYGGSLVPTFVSGGSGANGGNAGLNFMELMTAKAQMDLSLNMNNKK
jgi:regulator of protease activity HflC (stomatin/prohibitin superfamily)